VIRLKKNFPHLRIILNGGVTGLDAVAAHLGVLDGVMIGRKAYADPFFLSRIQAGCLNERTGRTWSPPSPEAVIEHMAGYAARQLQNGVPLRCITRHMAGLFAGRPGARRWRRQLGEQAARAGAGAEILISSLKADESG